MYSVSASSLSMFYSSKVPIPIRLILLRFTAETPRARKQHIWPGEVGSDLGYGWKVYSPHDWDRTQPGLPIKKGRAGTMTHDYKRNGTTTLFAELNILNGRHIGYCRSRGTAGPWDL